MLTSKTHISNLFAGINSPYNPYPVYLSNFQEVGRSLGINTNKYPELWSIYYHQIAVKSAQKISSFETADTKFAVDGLAAMKPLKHRKKDKNLTSHNSIIIQSELAKLTDDQLTTLVESGQLNFVIQNGRKIYLNSFD